MGYADDLYNLENVVGGYRNSRGQLEGAFFQKGHFFGFIEKDKGRNIVMHSARYVGTRKPDGSWGRETLHGRPIGARFRLVYPREGVLHRFPKDEQNAQEFSTLLGDHQELNKEHIADYVSGLHGYATKKLPARNYKKSTNKAKAWAIQEYFEESRPDGAAREQDRTLAMSEYNLLYRALYSNGQHPQETLLTSLGMPTPPSSPLVQGSASGTLDGLARTIINKPFVPKAEKTPVRDRIRRAIGRSR